MGIKNLGYPHCISDGMRQPRPIAVPVAIDADHECMARLIELDLAGISGTGCFTRLHCNGNTAAGGRTWIRTKNHNGRCNGRQRGSRNTHQMRSAFMRLRLIVASHQYHSKYYVKISASLRFMSEMPRHSALDEIMPDPLNFIMVIKEIYGP